MHTDLRSCGIIITVKTPNTHKHYNICRGEKIDLYSLASMVRKILNINCDIIVGEEGWKLEYTGNNQRLIGEMGAYSFVGFKESIAATSLDDKLIFDSLHAVYTLFASAFEPLTLVK